MVCPHLEYRDENEDHSFDHERPYCLIQQAFVSPMTADLCNDRDQFDHETHCEVYQRYHQNDDKLVPGLSLDDDD
ncbi:hypothetical protein [Haloarcula marina]|uniref:hypothetical protein n=1 Tax=Haloarcula marina TaxID=2961574 RepID=UPI0020B8078F|nr:hypothetical protein [Halomicroarcula marina]